MVHNIGGKSKYVKISDHGYGFGHIKREPEADGLSIVKIAPNENDQISKQKSSEEDDWSESESDGEQPGPSGTSTGPDLKFQKSSRYMPNIIKIYIPYESVQKSTRCNIYFLIRDWLIFDQSGSWKMAGFLIFHQNYNFLYFIKKISIFRKKNDCNQFFL